MADPDFKEFGERFTQALLASDGKDTFSVVHVDIPESDAELSRKALSCHTTEIATITRNADQDKSVLKPGLDRIVTGSEHLGACWGPIVEDDGNKAIIFMGWKSLDVSDFQRRT